jgi:hypothetical protein
VKSLDAPGRSSIACRIAFWAGCWWHQGLVCLLLPSNSQKPMGDGKGAKLFPSTPSTDGPCSIWEVDVAQLDHIRSPYLSYQKRFIFHIIYDYIYILQYYNVLYLSWLYIYIYNIFTIIFIWKTLKAQASHLDFGASCCSCGCTGCRMPWPRKASNNAASRWMTT